MTPFPAADLTRRVRARNRGRSWLLRAPILVWMAYLALRFLHDPSRPSIWSGINLAFHEVGHVLFGFLPDVGSVVGGTLTELAVPLVAAALFLRWKDDFAACLGLFWCSTALLGAAVYAGDARAQALPLVSPFSGDPIHDWNFLLGRLGLLERDQAVASVLGFLGHAAMLGSVLAGAWVLRLMATDPDRNAGTARAGGGLLGQADLEAEGQRLQAWLAARPSSEPGRSDRAPDEVRGSVDPGDLGPDELRDPVDPGNLSPEERRFLDFLEREKGSG